MQKHPDHSKPSEPDAGTKGVALTLLGHQLYARYGSSPGVISLGTARSQAGQIARFADRLPLLSKIQRKWHAAGWDRSPWQDLEWLSGFAPRTHTHGSAETTSFGTTAASAHLSPQSQPAITKQAIGAGAAGVLRSRKYANDSPGTTTNQTTPTTSGASLVTDHGQATTSVQRKDETFPGSATTNRVEAAEAIRQSAAIPGAADSSTLPSLVPLVHSHSSGSNPAPLLQRQNEASAATPTTPALRQSMGSLPSIAQPETRNPSTAQMESPILRRHTGTARAKATSEPSNVPSVAKWEGNLTSAVQPGFADSSMIPSSQPGFSDSVSSNSSPKIQRQHDRTAPARPVPSPGSLGNLSDAQPEKNLATAQMGKVPDRPVERTFVESPIVRRQIGAPRPTTSSEVALPTLGRSAEGIETSKTATLAHHAVAPQGGALAQIEGRGQYRERVNQSPPGTVQRVTSSPGDQILPRVRPNDTGSADKAPGLLPSHSGQPIPGSRCASLSGEFGPSLVQRHQDSLPIHRPAPIESFKPTVPAVVPTVQRRALHPTSPQPQVARFQGSPKNPADAASFATTSAPSSAIPPDADQGANAAVVVSREITPERSIPAIVQRTESGASETIMRKASPSGGDAIGIASEAEDFPRTILQTRSQEITAASPTAPTLHRSNQFLLNRLSAGSAEFVPGITTAMPAPSLFTHRSWRSLGQGVGSGGFEHNVSRVPGDFDRVQRLAVPSIGSAIEASGAQIPNIPMAAESASSMAQARPNTDINQLANRVYDLLVRRVTSERQRRGM